MNDQISEQHGQPINVAKVHSLGKEKVVTLVECYIVYYDVNGNAPADKDIVCCATSELANEICEIFENGEKVVVNKMLHYSLTHYGVEGYEWDCSFRVKVGWAEKDKIVTSVAEWAMNSEDFDQYAPCDLADGVYEGEVEEEEEG